MLASGKMVSINSTSALRISPSKPREGGNTASKKQKNLKLRIHRNRGSEIVSSLARPRNRQEVFCVGNVEGDTSTPTMANVLSGFVLRSRQKSSWVLEPCHKSLMVHSMHGSDAPLLRNHAKVLHQVEEAEGANRLCLSRKSTLKTDMQNRNF